MVKIIVDDDLARDGFPVTTPDSLKEAVSRLVQAGHAVSQEMGPWSPFGLYRIDNGPELTDMQFMQVAEDMLRNFD